MTNENNHRHLRVATRGSDLALTQSQWLMRQICAQIPNLTYEIVTIQSEGDLEPDRDLSSFGGKGVFSRTLEKALLDCRADLAIHSLKDLSVQPDDVFAFPILSARENPLDVLVTRKGMIADTLPAGAKCGTSSPRRQKQLATLYPHWEMVPMRGNVRTRLRKLRNGDCDVLVLAAAGLNRLNLREQMSEELNFEELSADVLVPPCGQGILVVQTLASNEELNCLLAERCDCERSRDCYNAERAMVLHLGASCQAPVGAYARYENEKLILRAWNGLGGEGYHKQICMSISDERDLALAKQRLVGTVSLVGAGPGDVGLFTLKGKERLRQADVVVYDRLGTRHVTHLISAGAERIYVGKQASNHSMRQEQINALLVRLAREGKRVVRLKGGDPFVFGRGGEELDYLKQNNIPFEVIPGVTSAVAAPAYAGIPVTHRGLASSFHVITAHEGVGGKTDALDFAELANTEGTLIFLMGVSNLSRVTQGLLNAGKAVDTPAAMIENGTLSTQRQVYGTLGTLEKLAAEHGVRAPAITVIGEVCALGEQLTWYEGAETLSEQPLSAFANRPLSGHTVLLTRNRPTEISSLTNIRATGQDSFEARIRNEGARVLELNLIRTHFPPELIERLDHGLRNWFKEWRTGVESDGNKWLVLTSINGVRQFFASLDRLSVDRRVLHHWKFAVVGSTTASALLEYGYVADLVPPSFDSRHLAEALLAVLKPNDSILAVRAKDASVVLEQTLNDAGYELHCLTAYDTVRDEDSITLLPDVLTRVTDLTFASSSAVKSFVSALEEANLNVGHIADQGIRVFAIGPVTADTIRGFNLPLTAQAAEYTMRGLAECMLTHYQNTNERGDGGDH